MRTHSPAPSRRQTPHSSGTSKGINEWFRRFAHATSRVVGSPWSFMIAVLVILVWAATGPMFHFSDTWQLVINTGTTIVTFLMVFLIQNTQNRDAKALHLKVDELILAIKGARNKLINLENLSEEELADLQKEFDRLCRKPDGTMGKPLATLAEFSSEREPGADGRNTSQV